MITSDLHMMFVAYHKLQPTHKYVMLKVADHYLLDFFHKNKYTWEDFTVCTLCYYGSGGELFFRDPKASDYHDDDYIDFRYPTITTNKWWSHSRMMI
jgi:hypothetical protein